MSNLLYFQNDFSKINLVLCDYTEKNKFIKYISNLPNYKNYLSILYKLEQNINDKQKIKYKNTLIFTNFQDKKLLSFQTIGKFKTPTFLLNVPLKDLNSTIFKIIEKKGNIIVSPNLQKKMTDLDFYFLKKNDINNIINKNYWIIYHNNTSYKFNLNYFTNYQLKKCKVKNFNMSEDDITEFFIENPIFYENQYETPVFF